MYILSLDLGRVGDYHGIVLTESIQVKRSTLATTRDMHEQPGTEILIPSVTILTLERTQETYPEIVEKTQFLMDHPRFVDNCTLIVDATGVGVPTMDFMRRNGLSPIGVWITGGSSVGMNTTGGYYTVPKLELINALQLASDSGYIEFANGIDPKMVEQLMHELRNFKEKKTAAGNQTWEAWREKDHDDLVLSLAMNIWWIMKVNGIQIVPPPRVLRTRDDYNPLADM